MPAITYEVSFEEANRKAEIEVAQAVDIITESLCERREAITKKGLAALIQRKAL